MIDVMIAMCGKRLTGALRISLALIMEATDVKSLKTESCAVVEVLREDCRADWMINNALSGVSSLPSEITSCFKSVLPALPVGPRKRNTRKAWLSKLHGQFESWMEKWKSPRVPRASNPLSTSPAESLWNREIEKVEKRLTENGQCRWRPYAVQFTLVSGYHQEHTVTRPREDKIAPKSRLAHDFLYQSCYTC